MPNQSLIVADEGLSEDIVRELARDPKLASPHTQKSYRLDLVRFEAWRAGRLLTKLLVEQYVAELQTESLSPTTINRRLSAVRWWVRRVADMAIEDVSMNRAMRDELVLQAERVTAIDNVKGRRNSKGRHLSECELAALMRACGADDSPAGVRDAALWISETRSVDPNTIQLVLHGKGDKDRTIDLAQGAAWALVDWLAVRGTSEGFVFCAILKNGRLLLDHGLSTEALAQILDKRRLQAGVADLTWHDFRRSFAGNLLNANLDLATVQKLMGHASPITTSAYDRRGAEVQREALGKLHVPYTQRALLPARKVSK